MLIRSVIVASMVLLAGAAQAAQSGLECLAAVSSDFIRQKVALFQATPLTLSPSIETVIAKRGLVEAYCLRYSHCWSDDTNSFVFQATFAGCVKQESERY